MRRAASVQPAEPRPLVIPVLHLRGAPGFCFLLPEVTRFTSDRERQGGIVVRLACFVRSPWREYVLMVIIWVASGYSVSGVRADLCDDYALMGSFELPPGSNQFTPLADGRILALAGDDVHLETSSGSRTFDYHGTLPLADISSFGAAFVRPSPDGTRIAVGNNGGTLASNYQYQVGVFAIADLTGTWFLADHWRAQWYDQTRIALTAGGSGPPSIVTILDTNSDPANPTNPVVIDNIGGSSAGIAFDSSNNLFTGNGWAWRARSDTGAIKAFDITGWMAAWPDGIPLDFELQGTLVADVLSADTLGFDQEGHLHVGGGDGAADSDFAALVHAQAISAALAGQGPADPTDIRQLDPDEDNPFDFYAVDYNAALRELYLNNYGETTVYVYAVPADSIPAVSEWGLMIMTLLALTFGTLVFRRHSTGRVSRVCPAVGPCPDHKPLGSK